MWIDELQCGRVAAKTRLDRVGVADVERRASGMRPDRRGRAAVRSAGRRGGRAEEVRAHVVLDADHVEARRDEVGDGLGADEAAGAGDDRECRLSSPLVDGERRAELVLVVDDPLVHVAEYRAHAR